MVLVSLPHGDGQVLAELLAREERPGGFERPQVSMTIWYRHVRDYSKVKRLSAGEGRPPGAPRYPMPEEEPTP